jgi:hypothetical protein
MLKTYKIFRKSARRFININTRIFLFFVHVTARVLGFIFQLTQSLEGRWIARSASQNILVYSDESTEKICIYASFQKSFSPILQMHLEELQQQGFAIIFISNLPIDEIFKGQLAPFVHAMITRANFGRDFAAYKAGYEYALSKKFFGADQLLFTNDTIVFPIIPTNKFWRDLDDLKADIVGPYVSYSPIRHLQSFFILVKNGVFREKIFSDFWTSYKNPNARMQVIKQGELGFSKYLDQVGIIFEGVVHPNKIEEMNESSNRILERLQQHFKFSALKDFIQYTFKALNPSHALSLIAVKSLRIPLLKKDLLSRGTLQPQELLETLSEIGCDPEFQDKIFQELRVKKLPSEKGIIQRVLELTGAK